MDLTGEETQKAFDNVLTNLARTAPPIPGFRRMKGGKILFMEGNLWQLCCGNFQFAISLQFLVFYSTYLIFFS